MRKILGVIFVVTLIFFSTIPVSAEDKQTQDLHSSTQQSVDHSVQINQIGDDEFFVLIPTAEDIYGFIPEMETFGFISGAIVVFKVVSTVLGACSVVEFFSEWNPCIAAKTALINAVNKKPGTYKYHVDRKWISGKIPGCQPMYSYQCNTGYYQYSFRRV